MHPSSKWLIGMITIIMLLPIPFVVEFRYPLILPYQWHKALHLLGVVLFMGNIIAAGVWMGMANRSKDPSVIHFATNVVNWADVFLTGPGLILIIYNGATLAGRLGGLYKNSWITAGFLLLVLSGFLWVGFLMRYQQKLYSLSKQSSEAKAALSGEFHILLKRWYLFGVIATVLPVITLIIMVLKPKLW